MEIRIGVFREPREEELEEGVHIFTRLPAPIDFRSTWVLVRESDADGLVNEQDVEILVPAVRVERYILSFVRDSTRSELE
jgi:hypothetical protein